MRYLWAILLGILGLLLVVVNQFNIDFVIQPLVNSDSFVHYKQLYIMYEGFRTFNPILFFSFNFNYGFLYFLSNFLISLPALILGSPSGMVFSVRLLASFFAISSIIVTYKSLRLFLSQPVSMLLSFSIALMPFFWSASGWFRSDWMMTFFILLSLYFFLKQDFKHGSFWYFVAFSIKTQALMFLPLYLLWILMRSSSFKIVVKTTLKWFLCLAGFYIITNPHILHPAGFYGIFRRFFMELTFFLTDRSHVLAKLSLTEKLGYFDFHFAPFLLILIFTLCSFVFFIKKTAIDPRLTKFSIITITLLIILIYLFAVSAVFPWKFLIPVIFLFIFSWIPLLSILSSQKQLIISFFWCAIIFGSHVLQAQYTPIFFPTNFKKDPVVSQNIAFVSQGIRPYLTANVQILCDPYVLLDWPTLGINPTHIQVFWENPVMAINPEHFNQKWAKVKNYKVKIFKPKDLVILKKGSYYFEDGNAEFKALLDEKLGYKVLTENEEVIILHRSL